jgi:hypothetical protein
MDLYQLLAKSLQHGVDVDESTAPDVNRPLTSLSTEFTEAVESTDEERGGALLGCVAP